MKQSDIDQHIAYMLNCRKDLVPHEHATYQLQLELLAKKVRQATLDELEENLKQGRLAMIYGATEW